VSKTLPDSWQWKSLRELATINYGKSASTVLSNDGEIPVVGTGGVERYGSDYLYDGESIVLGRKGSIDRVAFVVGKFWTIDTAYFLTDFKDETSVKWLYYSLQTIDLRSLNEATGVPSLSREVLYKLRVPTPPPPEQIKIAEVLSVLDRVIEQTEVLVAKQQRIKIGLMQGLLSNGIDEHGDIRSEATHSFKDSPLGRIPVEWAVTSIGHHFTERKERGKRGLPIMSVVMNYGLVERSSVDRRVETALAPEQHALVCKGDIAYNMMRMWQGVLGRASFDCLVSPAYVVLKPAESINSRFAEWLFRDIRTVHAFRQASKGIVDDRLRLYPKDLFPISITIPVSVEEQSGIADRLDAELAATASYARALNKLRHIRAGLMRELLYGERRVTTLLALAAA
jgi:type I restriction enzyme S subunit